MNSVKEINIEMLQNSAPYSAPSFAAPASNQHFPPHFIPQQPSMFGARGTTIPPRFLPGYQHPSARRGSFNHYNQPKREFWCEICDRSFCSPIKLEQHKDEHEKCGIEGCAFEAHPQVLERHREMQHRNGLFSKLQNLESDEEIAKWREERRKNYPTVKNVELRRKAQEEQMKRGERISESKSRFGERTNKSNKEGKNRSRKKRNQGGLKTKDSIEKSPEKQEVIPTVLNQGVPMFRGTSDLDEFAPLKKNPLAQFLSAYGSDSGSETDEEKSDYSMNIYPEKTFNSAGLSSQSADTQKSDVEISKEIEERKKPQKHKPQAKTNSIPVKKAKRTYEGLNYGFLRRQQPPTMLSKLLEGEIRHERNVLLQCVRFVVQNNFLEDKKANLFE